MMNLRNRRARFHPATVVLLLGVFLLPGAALAQSNTNTVAAQQELRIQELESQISALTGQVEQLSYQVRQLTDKLDRMTSDFDFRLTQLEGGGQGDGAGPTASAEDPAASSTASQDSAAAAPALQPAPAPAAPAAGSGGVTASTPGSGPKVLGTLTQTEMDSQLAKQQNSTTAAQQAMDATNAQSGATSQAGADQTAAVAPAELPGATADEQYQYAFGLLRENRYDDAEKALRSFISANPEHQLTGNANYWLGETYYVRGDYKNAAITFAQGVKNYPQSGKAPDNMMKLGMALAAMGQTKDACTAFGEVGKRYPQASDTLKDRVVKEQQKNSCK